ncbi:MAG: hypothetical protein Q8K07_09785 [Methylicorpusculum sp.]|uniref:hypothetical protein n=1 Tax=Methylicorpusculum sp. TaxID=2713644 RepID=UPI002731717D|nr:hypothetical protein [Methylicorpusculum sp.]MDP2202297.1 hypothetical protein [Methylicorpusculum sp.]
MRKLFCRVFFASYYGWWFWRIVFWWLYLVIIIYYGLKAALDAFMDEISNYEWVPKGNRDSYERWRKMFIKDKKEM